MNKFCIALIATLMLSGASLSFAQTEDVLQQKAEQILRSEPGAKKVTVREEVAPRNAPNDKAINFMAFDLNGDGVLSRDEVGEKLYEIFDRDGNEVIDNIEMKKPTLLVFTPMTKKTIEIIDYHSGDKPQKNNVSEEAFLQKSQLSKFDESKDGLSPLDFLGMPFNQVNVKRDGVIDLYEFKRAYAAIVKPKHEESFNYNN